MAKKAKKRAKKATRKTAAKPRATMSLHQLLGELSKALTEPLGSDERRRITLRVSNAKQRKPRKRAR
jgi:hypothetical protein